MTGYFKPLRRKIGVVTLLGICALELVSLRSRTVADQMTFRIGENGRYWLISNDDWISLASIDSGATTFPNSKFSYWKAVPKPNEGRGGPFSGINHSWDLHLRHHVSIPYGPVVIVLIPLTAWLLLSNRSGTKVSSIETKP